VCYRRRVLERERRTTVLAIAAIALVSGLARILPISDSDTPWHVFHGQRALFEHAARYSETTSFTRYGELFVNHEWLADIAFASVYGRFGWGGLSVLCGICAALSTALVGVLVVRAGGPRPLSIVVTAVVASACAFQVEARPQSFVLVLVPLGLLLADDAADLDRPVMRSAIALVVLQVVWAQIHSSFSLLPVFVAIALVSEAMRRGIRPVARRAALPIALIVLFATAPHRMGYFAMAFRHAKGDATAHITEWQPLHLNDIYPTRFNSILWLDVLIAIAVFRSVRTRQLRPDDAARGALGLALSLTAHRFRPLWAIFIAPWAVRSHGDVEPSSARSARVSILVAILGSIVIVALNTMNAFDRGAARGWGARLDRDAFPVDSAAALQKVGARGRLLNSYTDGGWLSLVLAGQIQIAIDGRTPLFFDDEQYFLMRRVFADSAALATVIDRWQPGLVLLARKEPMCRVLASDATWHAAYLDDKRTLFVRDASSFPALHRIDPCAPEASIAGGCPAAAELRGEIDAVAALVVGAPYPLLLGAQLEVVCGGDAKRAIELAQQALASGTRDPGSWLSAASTFARAGANDAAFAAVDLAIDLGAGPAARRLRGQLSLARNDARAAVEDLRAVVKTLDDETPPAVRRELARALIAIGASEEARIQLQRAAWTSPHSTSGTASPATSAPLE